MGLLCKRNGSPVSSNFEGAFVRHTFMHMDASQSVSAARLRLMLASLRCVQSGLEKLSKCNLGNDFEIVKVDRLHAPMSRTVDTPSGSKNMVMIDGFCILTAYNHEEPFGNLKAEQLEKSRYPADKQSLIESLGWMAKRTPTWRVINRATVNLGGLRDHGINCTKLEAAVLGV